MAASSKTRPYISSRFVLELDDSGSGQYMGTLQSIEGGTFKSEVLEEKVGGSGAVTKASGSAQVRGRDDPSRYDDGAAVLALAGKELHV